MWVVLVCAQVTPSFSQVDRQSSSLKQVDSVKQHGGCSALIYAFGSEFDTSLSFTRSERAYVYNLLSRCYLLSRDREAAKLNAERAIELLDVNKEEEIAELAIGYDNLGEYYADETQYKKALECYDKALELRNSLTQADPQRITSNQLNLALMYSYQADHIIAKSYLDSARTILAQTEEYPSELKGQYFETEAVLFNQKESFEPAIASYKKAQLIYQEDPNSNKIKIASIQSGIGSAYYLMWAHEKALQYFEESLAIYIRELGENSGEVTNIYYFLARIYGRKGEYGKALEYNKKTIAINKNLYGESDYRVGLSNAITGVVYSYIDDYENQLYYFEIALENFISNLGKEHPWVITTYENIGRVHYRLGAYKTALEYYKEGLAIAEKMPDRQNAKIAHIYLNAADAYAAVGDNQKAQDLYEKSLSIQLEIYGEKHREVVQNYIAQGNFQAKLGNYSKAIQIFDNVLALYYDEIEKSLNESFIQVEFNILFKIIDALESKATWLFRRYMDSGDLKDLKEANKTYEISTLLSDKMRLGTVSLDDKIKLTSYHQPSYKGATRTRVMLYEETGDEIHLEEAFRLSEKNRAGVMQEFLQRSNTRNKTGIMSPILALESQLILSRIDYLSKIKNEKNKKSEKDSDQLLVYEEKLFELNRRYDSVLDRIQLDYPKYFAVEHGIDQITIDEMQAILQPSTTLIEYFITDEVLIAFVATNKSFQIFELENYPGVGEIEEFRQHIKLKNKAQFKKSAFSLYSQLLKPFADKLQGTQLIIIPDGPLWHLNFDLLLTEEHPSNNPKKWPYLLRDYAISFANSANYLHKVSKQPSIENARCLAFSFSDSLKIEENNSLTFRTLKSMRKDLPGSRREIREISEMVEGKYFYGSAANEANFKARARDYEILHLALHGEVDQSNPENSRLYFTQVRDSVEDNFLYGHELIDMDLPSELTVLSACNSGSGKILPGEGIMSLGNAFQYAGSKSLLMTQWQVSDNTAPEIIRMFYLNLKNGIDKATALQKAKLEYLNNADIYRSDPFYWGSFFLVGDTGSITLKSTSVWPYVLTSMVMVLLIYYFGKKIKFRHKVQKPVYRFLTFFDRTHRA